MGEKPYPDPEGPFCHHSGQWHAVPYALIKLVEESLSHGNYSTVKWTSPGGNTAYARPVVIDGRLLRIDFCTDPGD